MFTIDIMTWVPKLHKRVVSVGLHTVHLHTFLVFCMFVSLFATLFSIPLKSYEKVSSGNKIHFDDTTFFLLNCGVIIHFFTIRRQPTNMTVLTEFLLEPFRSYPLNSSQQRLVRGYYRKFAISWLLMGANLVLCVLGQCLSALVTVLRLSEDVDLQDWPLPLGRVILFRESEWVYWSWYFVSVSSLLTCAVIHSCWFGTFMCSTLLIATKLELLALEVGGMNERVRKSCEEDLKNVRCLTKWPFAVDKVCFRVTKTCFREVVDENVRIIQQVRLLDSTYRWIILVYIEITVLATALIVTISISEWDSGTNQGILRLDVLFACIFFSFINNLCGQTVIDQFEKLRLSLYNVHWVDQSPTFKSSLLIMLTTNNRPPHLTAGSIFRLSLASFKQVMEAIYSYINFLITVRKL